MIYKIYIYNIYIYIYIYVYIYIYIISPSLLSPKGIHSPKLLKQKFANIYCSPLEKSPPSVLTLQPTRNLHLDFDLACATIESCLQ